MVTSILPSCITKGFTALPEPFIIELPDKDYDIYNSNALVEAVAPSLLHREVILDFHHVHYLDSTALTVLVGFRKRRAEMGFPPKRFIHVSDRIRMLLRISQLDKIWPICKNADEAAASFGD